MRSVIRYGLAIVRFGVTMPPEVPMITEEQAYTSPIWYTPQ